MGVDREVLSLESVVKSVPSPVLEQPLCDATLDIASDETRSHPHPRRYR
jgi:hypothetical protein